MVIRKKEFVMRFLAAIIMAGCGLCPALAAAEESAAGIQPYIKTLMPSSTGLTMGQMVQAGGSILYILIFLSFVLLALVVFNLLTLREERLIPRKFMDDLMDSLERGDVHNLRRMCASADNLIARIVSSGLEKKMRGIIHAKEAMEIKARKEIGVLWQNITYMSDIATVAPLLGLLGTVVGMIQAFNVVAFQTAMVKPILLAGGVSKAMITTAGGLIVAIPAMIFYAYFRGRVQQIVNTVEGYVSDIIKIFEESMQRSG
jgi:biopolymer transport protein ExbB